MSDFNRSIDPYSGIGGCVPPEGHVYSRAPSMNYPPSWEKIPLLSTRGYVTLRGWGRGVGSVGRAFDCQPMFCRFESLRGWTFRWVIKGLGMSSRVYATGYIKDPVPHIEKRRGLSPGGRFPPSFINQVIIITGLNKL